ncbi:porin [Aestuariicella hydrocarbonica]|uniref:Porin n=1 Tax=Pseudomaricurvus hydrocarbonicus TaxID=1470433 RepID=A0A9E5JVW3_9GAMM|nr:porin [Aestuariicella hydrocarbonica]NHO65531.1 porin [Aestuariicella hydrocarbonica]
MIVVRCGVIVAALLAWSLESVAAEVVGKRLEVYGVMHGSVDYRDSGVPDALVEMDADDKYVASDWVVSSNSSRLGVRGALGSEDGWAFLYQWEHGLVFAETKSDAFVLRNSFVGFRSPWGEVLLGRHDTPFKMVGTGYSVMNDTVADRGALIGAGALTGSLINTRADKMVMWRNKVSVPQGTVDWVLQYSQDCTRPNKHLDNNGCKITAVGLQWQGEVLSLAAAHDHWTQFYGSDIDATRLAARVRWGDITLGLIADLVRQDSLSGVNSLDREAYGVNAIYGVGAWGYIAQAFVAKDYDHVRDSGAVMLSAGVERKVSASLKGYLIYTQTNNDRNARYQGVDGAHGYEVATLPGGLPRAVSVGVKYSF